MPEVIIELDAPPPDDPGRRSAGRPRRWLVTLCVLGVLAGGTGSVANPGPTPWATPFIVDTGASLDGRIFLAGDHLFAHEPVRGQLTAWDLRGRTLAWRLDVGLDDVFTVEDLPGAVIVSGAVNSNGGVPTAHTAGIDPATGTLRWVARGLAYAVTPAHDRLLVLESDGEGFVATGIDPVTGARMWRYADRDAGLVAPGSLGEADASGVDDVVIRRWDGTLLLLSVATGRSRPLGGVDAGSEVVHVDAGVVVARTFRPSGNPPAAGEMWSRPGDRVPVGEPSLRLAPGIPAALTGFDRSTLRPLWQRAIAVGEPSFMHRCAPTLLCQTGGATSVALDADTGRELWRTPSVPVRYWARPDGPLLLARTQESGYETLLDPSTGVVRLRLDEWRVAGIHGTDLVVVRPGVEIGRSTWIGVVSGSGDLRVRPIAAVAPGYRVGDCLLAGGWIACHAGSTKVVFAVAEGLAYR